MNNELQKSIKQYESILINLTPGTTDYINNYYQLTECRKNFNGHLESMEVEVLQCRDNLVRWLFNVHNLVNVDTGKSQYSYDDFIKKIFAVELIDAYPIGIASQALSWTDDNFHRLSVQFTYQKYRVIYDGEYNLTEAATALFGAKAATLFDRAGQNVMDSIGNTIKKIF